VLEPISPELVLVDPELAARVRASPVEHAAAYAPRATGVLTRTVEALPRQHVPAQPAIRTDVRPGRRRVSKRLGVSLLGISLMVSGFVAGSAVSGNQSEQTGVALPEARATPPAPDVVSRGDSVRTLDRRRPASVARTTARKRAVAKPQRRSAVAKPQRRSQPTTKRRSAAAKPRKQPVARAAPARQTSAAVERKLLSVIVLSPAGKLPPVLIDSKTGLAKNNLHAVCTRSNDARSFLCVVTSALHRPAGPVYAFYRSTKTGRGGFTWYRSRSGAAARRTSAAVERELLGVIVQSPAGKLPPVLINRRTGLAKNNLQAVCTRSNDSRSFLCVVTSALQVGAGPVYAFYRPTKTGRGGFRWYRGRSG
jgi:hypothetical protein